MIRNEYAKAKIALKPKQGLCLALEEAKALSANLKSSKPCSDAEALVAAQAFHVIYPIADSIELCVRAELDITRHLA